MRISGGSIIIVVALMLLNQSKTWAAEEPGFLDYIITKDEKHQGIKRTVEVELPEAVNEKTLELIAEEITSLEYTKFERTFIGYRLEGESK